MRPHTWNHTHSVTFAVFGWLEASHRSCPCWGKGHEHQEVGHGAILEPVLYTSSLSSYCVWLIFLIFLCSRSRKEERVNPLIPLHPATSHIPAGRVSHLCTDQPRLGVGSPGEHGWVRQWLAALYAKSNGATPGNVGLWSGRALHT